MKNTLVSSLHELNELLSKKYGKDIETDPFGVLFMGNIVGTFRGEKFNITFEKDEYLLISISNSGVTLLDELMPVLNEVMGIQEPIARYDLQAEGMNEKEAMPIVEWDIKDPESRIKEVVNGRAYSDKSKLHNLTLFGGRKVESYIEDEKAKEERIANARIYGIDPGSIKDVAPFKTMGEIDLYFNINAMGHHIWSCWHNMLHETIPEINLTEEQYALEYMVYQTTRFGVELPEPQIDKHIVKTPSYSAWFNFFDNHFQNILTDAEWEAFQRAQKNKQDVSKYMPKGNWQDTLITQKDSSEKPFVKILS